LGGVYIERSTTEVCSCRICEEVTLQVEIFHALLQALDADPEKAGQEYRRLHQRLVRFFSLHPVTDPYNLADEAMDRLGRRIATSAAGVDSPGAFLFGIARHVLQEDGRHRLREGEIASEWTAELGRPAPPDEELIEQVERCLGKMKKEQRELLLAYYRATGRAKIEHHRELAAGLGLTLNALRNRLMRARRELDNCVRQSRDVSGSRDTRK
jgi:DNA-directed RNA polymerase specialized sigma24 family protein